MEVKDYYTTSEVANMLRVDVQTVRKYIRQGKIKATHMNSRTIRIPYEQISYLMKGTNE